MFRADTARAMSGVRGRGQVSEQSTCVHSIQNQFFSSDLERARDTGLAITSLQPGLELLLWPSLRYVEFANCTYQNKFYLVTFQ